MLILACHFSSLNAQNVHILKTAAVRRRAPPEPRAEDKKLSVLSGGSSSWPWWVIEGVCEGCRGGGKQAEEIAPLNQEQPRDEGDEED